MEQWWIIGGLMIPFIGTVAGAAVVFLMKSRISVCVEKLLTGLASGVMLAASVWSLLLPSLSLSEDHPVTFLPAVTGLLFGVLFLMLTDRLMPKWILKNGRKKTLCTKKNVMMIFAVTLHNIPEGMAVGIALAAAFCSHSGITAASAMALSVGIAIQNFPEGAIISMPLKSEGRSKERAFLMGMLSGVVEPIFGFITILLTSLIIPMMPYLLAFAAGAMIYVVAEELIPEAHSGRNSEWATIGLSIGFALMMALDVTFG